MEETPIKFIFSETHTPCA